MSKASIFIILGLLLIINKACDKAVNQSILESEWILVPAGRSTLGPGNVEILLNDQKIEPELFYDECGGYWYRIPSRDLKVGDIMQLLYLCDESDSILFREEASTSGIWLDPSHYIDSDHEDILAKAEKITQDLEGDSAMARKLQLHIAGYFGYKIYMSSFEQTASQSLALGYGTCMNASRLFVAMCRALEIPARTVWGAVADHDGNGGHGNHHQWAEFQDKDGFWHPCDFGYTSIMDLNDLRYLDLLYGAEENPLLKNRMSQYPLLGDVEYFRDYPAPLHRMGFRMEEDNRPDNMIVSHTITF